MLKKPQHSMYVHLVHALKQKNILKHCDSVTCCYQQVEGHLLTVLWLLQCWSCLVQLQLGSH